VGDYDATRVDTTATPRLSFLIVSFNTRELTLAAIASVYAHTAGDFEVIVVDNASEDGSADAIAETFPGVRLVRSTTNDGFAVANNTAAKLATGDVLVLLNSDAELLDDAATKAAMILEEDAGVGAVGGRTLFGDRSLNHNSCHGAPTPWSVFCLGTGLASLFRRSQLFHPEGMGDWARDTRRDVDAVTGCFLVMRRSLWNELGGFDTSFFMYGEDTDLCLRVREKGLRCVVTPEATLIHHGGRSDRVRVDKMVRLFRAKHQLFVKHWRRPWPVYGRNMLKLQAGSRAAALSFMGLLIPGKRKPAKTWREIWRRRCEYAALD